ncbi:MAG: hypothetical protein ACLQPV_03660 [Vulcanimicrobiaceae bacterium]
MADPMKPEFTAQNPIVAAAEKIRARREIGAAIDSATHEAPPRKPEDAEESLRAFADRLAAGSTLLNSIVGAAKGAKLVRLEKPLRVRLRFGGKRVALDLDDVNQLVRVTGCGLDGDYQFDLDAPVPSLINLSKISTEAGYGERVTPSWLLKMVAQDAELPRPSHLDATGPLQF